MLSFSFTLSADCVQEVLKGSQRLRRQTTELPLISDLEEPDQPETEITTKTVRISFIIQPLKREM